MITITVDEDYLKDMLVDRVRSWTDDEDTIDLFEEYYEHMVGSGCFDGGTVDVMSIVDNDYCNNTTIMTEEEYEKAREEALKEDDSVEAPTWENLEVGEAPDFIDGSYIEAKTSNAILLSW